MAIKTAFNVKEVIKLWAVRKAVKALKATETALTKSIKANFVEGDYTVEKHNVGGMEVHKYWQGLDANGQPAKRLDTKKALEMITAKKIKGIATTKETIVKVNEEGLRTALAMGKITLEDLEGVYTEVTPTMMLAINDKRAEQTISKNKEVVETA